IDQPYNFDLLFGSAKYVARRRRFLPCLSRSEDGSPRGHAVGVYVEYSADNGATWQPIDALSSDENSVQILQRECGIRFNGENVPFDLYLAGDSAKVRVTACVESDTRVSITDGREGLREGRVLKPFKRQYLLVGSKFKKNKRDRTSIFEDTLEES